MTQPVPIAGFRTASLFLPAGLFVFAFGLYISTLAPGLVFGDPAEYTLMPGIGAILHPPGYAFMTLLVAAWQALVPVGTLAYRTNLLSAAAAALAGALVYASVRLSSPPVAAALVTAQPTAPAVVQPPVRAAQSAALLAALSLYTASDFWQHALHANAHIVTAALASLSLFLLLRWRASGRDAWLYAFAVVGGLSVTHHPLLAFGFPACGLFILIELFRPTRLIGAAGRPARSALKRLAGLLAFGLLGLAPWLYFPIRSALQPPPPFGPHDLNTLDGFLNLVLARGLAGVNLFHFGPAEQWHRLIVFWSLAQLQFAWPVLLLAGLGLIWLARRDARAALLLGLHAALNLAFTLNSVQDVMAYLLVPLVSLAILVGAGGLALADGWARLPAGRIPGARWVVGLLLLFPFFNLAWLYPRISLRSLRDADAYVESLVVHFRGRGEGAVLLSDWEHMTPLWYKQYVEGLQLDPRDLSVVYVNGPFVDAVWAHIDRGPIYLLEYNPAVAAAGFRLRAEGPFYRLEPPPAAALPAIPHPADAQYGPVTLLGYDVLAMRTPPGGVVPILLYVRVDAVSHRIIHPFARLGAWEYRFTTDSHLLSPNWQAGEVIVERWEVTVPLDAPAGDYPLEVGFSDLTTGEDFGATESLGEVTVSSGPASVASVRDLTANFGQQVGIERAWAWAGAGVLTHTAPWADSLVAKPGEPIEIRLQWQALESMANSYTVFIHVLTADNVLIASSDYTPLGGAWPTLLWFPRWLPGQTAVDPYSLAAPAEPGDYYIEVGLYGLRSVQRLAAYDAAGDLAGDRFVLGAVTVAP